MVRAMRYLIVSADDFGLTRSVNEGIVRASREGIVTSLNLIPTGEAFAHAIKLAAESGVTEAGAHLALTETGPLAEPRQVRTLIAGDGRFCRKHGSFILRLIAGAIDLGEAYVELKRQMDAVAMSGLRITNLSSHEHIHMIPAILDIFIRLAKEYGVPAIRCLHDDVSFAPGAHAFYKGLVLAYFQRRMGRAIAASGLARTDHFRGLLDSGGIREGVLLGIVGALKEGTTELVCHPGIAGPEVRSRYAFHAGCGDELAALTSARVRSLIQDDGIALSTYGEFLSRRRR